MPLSFDFCFESPQRRTFEVFSGQDPEETAEISYEIRPGGEVLVDPWPFSVPSISGIVYAFERQRYPQELNPIVVPFNIQRG